MIRRPPRSTRTDTLFPYTTLFRSDRVILGDPYPDFSYGFNTQLAFGNFDLGIFIQGEQGKELWNANQYYHASSFYRGTNNVAAVRDRWTQENPNTNAAYPNATSSLNIQWSVRFVEDEHGRASCRERVCQYG